MQFSYDYDGKNDKHSFEYKGAGGIELVNIGGRAMQELGVNGSLGAKEQQDIGTAIAEYLVQEGISSLKDSPVFILPASDKGIVENAIATTSEMTELCHKYLNE